MGGSTQSLTFSRSERHEVTRHSTLLAEIWQTDDEYASSQDGSWFSVEERSDKGSGCSSGSEYLPGEHPEDLEEWSLDKIEYLH